MISAKIICGDCGETLTLSNSKAMREHALGTYSFLCGFCYEEEA